MSQQNQKQIIECVDLLNKIHKADLMLSISNAVSGIKIDDVDKANLLHINKFLKELIRVQE